MGFVKHCTLGYTMGKLVSAVAGVGPVVGVVGEAEVGPDLEDFSEC